VTGVFDAIRAGDLERVRQLAADDPLVGRAREGETGASAVMTALYHGRRDLAEALLPPDEALDVWEAAALGRTDRLRAILDAEPAHLERTSPDGFRPLALAAFFGHDAGARLLLERGADIEARGTGEIRTTALQAAAAANETAIARLLLEAGADPNAEQPGGFTALDSAIQNGNDELQRLLRERGATPRG
jgi:ankyrin repeat protein